MQNQRWHCYAEKSRQVYGVGQKILQTESFLLHLKLKTMMGLTLCRSNSGIS